MSQVAPHAGAPVGHVSPPPTPRRSSRPAAVDQHSPAPRALGRAVGRPSRRLRGPLGGYHPRGHHRVPPPGRKPLAPPRDPHAGAVAMLASFSQVFAMWYAVMQALGAPQPPPQQRYPCAGGDVHARAWLALYEHVAAWRRCRRVQVVFHVP